MLRLYFELIGLRDSETVAKRNEVVVQRIHALKTEHSYWDYRGIVAHLRVAAADPAPWAAGEADGLDLPYPGPGLVHKEDCRPRCREASKEHSLAPVAGAGDATPMPGGSPGSEAVIDERQWVSAHIGSIHEGVRDVRDLPALHD